MGQLGAHQLLPWEQVLEGQLLPLEQEGQFEAHQLLLWEETLEGQLLLASSSGLVVVEEHRLLNNTQF